MMAHAESSTAVKVTNSANNPAVTQDVGQSSGQMVHFTCVTGPNNSNSCYDSVSFQAETPANKNLVITAIDLMAFDGLLCPNATYVGLQTNGSVNGFDTTRTISTWTLIGNSPTMHFTYPPGFAVTAAASGSQGFKLVFSGQFSNCNAKADIFGYYTAN